MKYWERKELVRDLRREGLSYKEIRQKIPFTIAKSTISSWCRDIELTDEQKKRLGAKYDILHRGAKTNQTKRAKEIEQIIRLAKTEM
jgi:intein-encoded DNA endonuclease-like protein